MLEVKLESNVNVVIEDLTMEMLKLSPFETLAMPEEPGSGKLIDINERSSCGEKNKDV